jgi:hypothetical protein
VLTDVSSGLSSSRKRSTPGSVRLTSAATRWGHRNPDARAAANGGKPGQVLIDPGRAASLAGLEFIERGGGPVLPRLEGGAQSPPRSEDAHLNVLR